MKLLEMLFVVFTSNVLSLGNAPLMFPLLRRGLVLDRHLMTDDQLLFAYAIGRITPGQANLYIASVGYLIDGLTGAVAALFALMLPSYLMVPMLGGYERFRSSRRIQGVIKGLTVTSVGLIFASTVEVGRSSLINPVAWIVFGATIAFNAILRWNPFVSLAAGSAVGFALHAVWPA